MTVHLRHWPLLFAGLALAGAAQASVVLSEGFDDLASSGWVLTNNSLPAGNSWYQGVPEYFDSQAGAPSAYAVADYLSVANGVGPIDNWLISPEMVLNGAATLSFYARTEDVAGFADSMQVRFSSGAGSATAGFTTLLMTVLAETSGWTQYSLLLPAAASGRIAFEYLVDDANNANVIAVDSVLVTTAAPVPEPASPALVGLALAGMALLRRRRP